MTTCALGWKDDKLGLHLAALCCHSEPVRHSNANGPERSEGAQGKLREESALEAGEYAECFPMA